MIDCADCGNIIGFGANFCSYCGLDQQNDKKKEVKVPESKVKQVLFQSQPMAIIEEDESEEAEVNEVKSQVAPSVPIPPPPRGRGKPVAPP